MPCTTQPNMTPTARAAQRSALARLQAAIGAGSVTVVVSASGAVALRGWAIADRADVTDLCAYRELRNTPEMRRAVMRAEALAGRTVDARTIAAGVHSHDGGQSWGSHHG
jgi:hypothetical protein